MSISADRFVSSSITHPTVSKRPMSEKKGAYGSAAATDTDFRKKWDKEEYAEKARKRDAEEKERMKENEERIKQGP